MKSRTYTEQEFVDAVASSTAIRQVLSKLNLAEAGGNYQTVKTQIKRLNLDSSHFLGKRSGLGRKSGPKRPITAYLSNAFPIHSHSLKLRLISEGYFTRRCCVCKRSRWMKQPIPLELEHKDGNHHNNALENLELLCPNCHALTSTYRGKNINRASRIRTDTPQV